ncbi:glycine--tRNA ligase subunit beta [Erythrobacter sp. SCSIO 43205]|uniref:glycine--tRNA ligase subunit beta n=1 Tax=Erythrobacter sp. SCSIO 43205 TaxID=2779361 RepID=UPI001CA8DFA9|nr:glycine--tRNA ligase subunit beta [Erythrobacter sp. SCSIO 43205]UAB77116.1 glycine--tRNA ligase subunit beta [Erythrobacter sp. SCSIO 43205]
MADFLLELLTEEIPARMQKGARGELEKLFARELSAAGVEAGPITVWSTPRRLALIARSLPTQTEAVREEVKGPPVGAPDQAVDGFCRKNGVTREQLEEREVKGRATYFAVIEKPGQQVSDLLAAAIPAIIRDFSWPKSMRWGEASISSESTRWVRPLSGILALLGGEVVPVVMDGLSSGRETMGHRFHSSGLITIDGADDYAEKLRAAHVIVDHEERATIIREGAKKAAQEAGLVLVEDEGLVVENAGLTEWPVPLLGCFDEEFLDVPPEVIQLTARVNQKYFVCETAANDGVNRLANAFICTANIDAVDPAVVVDGNRKVLAARLSDARFFWELDQKTSLEEHAKGLERITFHEDLGSLAARVERIRNIASERLPELVGWPEAKAREMQPKLRKAADLAKADLVTEMVGEFPELQALMGYYYAQGLGGEIAEAIRDHYKPTGPSDELPSNEIGNLLAIADKADALFGFFAIGQKPTGSKDPFALRRAALGIIRIVVENGIRLNLRTLFSGIDFERMYQSRAGVDYSDPTEAILAFLADRLKVQQREAGVRHDLIDAVFALGGEDDLVRLLARVHALQSFIETDNGANLLAGYKRAANILKKEGYDQSRSPAKAGGQGEGQDGAALDPRLRGEAQGGMAPSHTPEPAEAALIAALDAAEPKAAAAIEAEDFAAAMEALASLRGAVDRFFEDVIVNAEDKNVRASRLSLLARLRDAVHKVADFSRIEG